MILELGLSTKLPLLAVNVKLDADITTGVTTLALVTILPVAVTIPVPILPTLALPVTLKLAKVPVLVIFG